MRIAAESAQILNYLVHLLRGQSFTERWHDLRKPASRPTVSYDRLPGGVRFRSSLVARGEIGESARRFKPGNGLGHPCAVRTMTGNAPGLENLLSRSQVSRGTGRSLSEQHAGGRHNNERMQCQNHRGETSTATVLPSHTGDFKLRLLLCFAPRQYGMSRVK